MHCPFCNSAEIFVKDSRAVNESIRRRRECKQCDGKFTTLEVAQITDQILIHGSSLQYYSHSRLLQSLLYVSNGQFTQYKIEKYLLEIERMLNELPVNELKLEEFIRQTVTVLYKFDSILAFRFLCSSSLNETQIHETFEYLIAKSVQQTAERTVALNQLELNLNHHTD